MTGFHSSLAIDTLDCLDIRKSTLPEFFTSLLKSSQFIAFPEGKKYLDLFNTGREVAKLAAFQLQSAFYMLDSFVRSPNVQKHSVRFVIHFCWPPLFADITVVDGDVLAKIHR